MTKNNWTKCKLGDVCYPVSNTYNLAKRKEIIFINTGDILEGKFLKNTYEATEQLPGQAKKAIEKDDILFSEIRPENGRYALVDFDAKEYVVSTKLMVIRAKPIIWNIYLYKLLTNKYAVKEFQHIAESRSGTFPQITFDAISHYPVSLPPMDEQKRIAGVLGAFDDKIELLQKQNKTLEDMAKAIFKSWFVDFDIVKAKQRGEDKQKILSTYKITEELYNLFPSSFTDAPASSSFGPIPTGWEVKQIKDICKMDRGLSYKSENLVPSDTALVTLKSFNRGGGYRLDGLKSYYGKYKAEQEVVLKDIVVACTDVTQNAEVVGKPAIVLSKYPFKKLLASCDLVILRPYEENKRAFIWQLLMSEYYQKYILAFVSGTTVLHLNKEGINIYQFPFSSQIASCFSSLVNTYIDKIISNYNQIQTLTELRDGLLPRLLSGKLQV